MNFALLQAEKALANNEIPVGAIIHDPARKKIITKSYNLVECKKDPTAHAEMLAIKKACKKTNSKFLTNLDLYVTLEPCSMCLQAIIYAKINRIYFGAYATNVSISVSKINHSVEIYGGIQEEKCQTLLNDFFKGKRA